MPVGGMVWGGVHCPGPGYNADHLSFSLEKDVGAQGQHGVSIKFLKVFLTFSSFVKGGTVPRYLGRYRGLGTGT